MPPAIDAITVGVPPVAAGAVEGGALVHGEGAEDGGLPHEGEHALACVVWVVDVYVGGGV